MTGALAASDQLTLALLNMAARGERTHCSDPTTHHLWLSEHEGEIQVASCCATAAQSSPSAVRQQNCATNAWASGVAAI
jgi:hypothetical protein